MVSRRQLCRLRPIHCLLLVSEVLPKRVVLHMLVYMVLEVVREGQVSMMVVNVVVYRGMPHRVVVELIVMVGGPRWQHWYWQGAHRCRHREQVCSRRLPHPPRRWSRQRPSKLRVLWLPIVHL